MKEMTKEQNEAYNEFMDFMCQLYKDFSYLLDDETDNNKNVA